MVIVVDTGVWIDLFRGRDTDCARHLRELMERDHPIYATDVVYAELLSGSYTDDQTATITSLRTRDRLLRLHGLDDFERAASCRRAAGHEGLTVRSITDCLIASVCIREDAVLLHDDCDFRTLASCTELRELVP
jgi:predicted nucleic acid-binding protein